MTRRLDLTEEERKIHFREQARRANQKFKQKQREDPAAREARNTWAREHAKRTYWRRKSEAVAYLGDKCVDCGTAALALEFDHRVPADKAFGITSNLVGMRWEKLVVELDKCDLRCISCHQHRTAVQRIESIDVLGTLLQGV